MIDVCPKCGLRKELCVCEAIAKESQKIVIGVVEKRYGKKMTTIEVSNTKDIDLKELLKILKSHFACGGTIKNKVIELQGNHVNKVKEELIKLGFGIDSIEIK
ncbi:MAG: stress response translation initiation inhibitor YciH [Nanoarchaeota archaeon]